MAGGDTFEILFVCTGNICRSPMGERLARHQLLQALGDDSASFYVASAGTTALVGQPMQQYAADLLRDSGVDANDFRARQVSRRLVVSADLVLTMTREHRAEIAMAVPDAVPRLFTLHEFARLAPVAADEIAPGSEAVGRARALVPAAADRRARSRPAQPSDDDVSDPYGGSPSGYRRPFGVIQAAVATIVSAVAGPDRVPKS